MKKTIGLLAFLLIIALTSSLVTPVLARTIFDMDCPDCHGSGEITVEETCPTCHGTGECTGTCPTCHGTGEVEETCPKCDGTGKIKCPYCHPDRPGYITCPKCNGDVYREPLKWEETWWNHFCYRGAYSCFLDIKNVDDVGGSVEVTIWVETTWGERYSETSSRHLEPGETGYFYASFATCSISSCGYDVDPENVVKTCPMCGGTGLVECPHCHGTGKLTCSDCGGKGTITVTCPDCNGTGTATGACPNCDGTGKVYVKIPCPYCGGKGYVTNWVAVGGTGVVILAAVAVVIFALRRYTLAIRRRKKLTPEPS